MELDDVGKETAFIPNGRTYTDPVRVKVIMTIGTSNGDMMELYADGNVDLQYEAIRAFMEQHHG